MKVKRSLSYVANSLEPPLRYQTLFKKERQKAPYGLWRGTYMTVKILDILVVCDILWFYVIITRRVFSFFSNNQNEYPTHNSLPYIIYGRVIYDFSLYRRKWRAGGRPRRSNFTFSYRKWSARSLERKCISSKPVRSWMSLLRKDTEVRKAGF